jgi:hypothetical protein
MLFVNLLHPPQQTERVAAIIEGLTPAGLEAFRQARLACQTATAAHNLVWIAETTAIVQVINPQSQRATIDPRIRPADLPAGLIVSVEQPSVTLDPGQSVRDGRDADGHGVLHPRTPPDFEAGIHTPDLNPGVVHEAAEPFLDFVQAKAVAAAN